jgi:hypothetical protein
MRSDDVDIASGEDRVMPLLLALNVFVQLAFVVHVCRSDAPRYWVFVIVAFPIVGCLAYFALEVFPSSREATAARRAAQRVVAGLDLDKGLRTRVAELELCGSIDNRTALAEECLASGMPAEAAKLYRSCLAGAYENDPHLRFGLAQALVEQRAWEDGAEVVDRLRADHPCHRSNDTRLLHARVLEGHGETAAALEEYRELVPAFVGLEARCRYGLLLERMERADEAHALFAEAVTQWARTPSPVASEQRWAKVAREHAARRGAA